MFPFAVITTLATLLSVGIFARAAESTESNNELSDRYIVTLKPSAGLDRHLDLVNNMVAKSSVEFGIFSGISHNYTIGNFKGYAGHFDNSIVNQLKAHEDVATVEPDRLLETTIMPSLSWPRRNPGTVTQKDASYALNMISHREPGGSDYVYKSAAGRRTYAYVIDTGILTAHKQFGNRATVGFDLDSGPKQPGQDPIGQGTAIAALIGGDTYGVAKKCSLISVKVASNRGQVMVSWILRGLEWAVKDIVAKKRQAKAVVTLGFDVDGDVSGLNNALGEAFDKGISVVIGAGHGSHMEGTPGKDAGYGMRLARGPVVVAAADRNRKRAGFSNWGPKVTLFAPGVEVVTVDSRGPMGSRQATGTGVSCAYVSGLLLYLKSIYNLPDAKSTTAKLLELATKDVVQDAKGSPPMLAYNGGG